MTKGKCHTSSTRTLTRLRSEQPSDRLLTNLALPCYLQHSSLMTSIQLIWTLTAYQSATRFDKPDTQHHKNNCTASYIRTHSLRKRLTSTSTRASHEILPTMRYARAIEKLLYSGLGQHMSALARLACLEIHSSFLAYPRARSA